jgi:hypothetical protein
MAPFRVAVDLTREDPVWGVLEDGTIVNLLWPPGFSLRTTPEVAVVDDTGKVVARPGHVISDAGGEPGPPAIICSIGGVHYPLNRAP